MVHLSRTNSHHFPKMSSVTLYFGNVDPQLDDSLMYQLFLQFAPIKLLHMPKDRILHTHQGFGFVEFFSNEDAEYTENILRGIRLYGRPLKLNRSESDKDVVIGAKLFVSNLNPLVDEEFLTETFSKYGDFARPPEVVRDEEGNLKNHGFITYTDFTVSDNVIKIMDGKLLMGNKVKVEYARKLGGANGQHHGDAAERLLIESGKANSVIKDKSKSRKRKRG